MNESENEVYHFCRVFENDWFRILPDAMYNRIESGSVSAGTNQIDFLVLTKKGLFVLEVKDYKGWVFGNENHKEWTVTSQFHGMTKHYKFRNPVKQNDNHIKTITKILSGGNINIPIHNVVVFANRTVLKAIDSHSAVINTYKLFEVFQQGYDIDISIDEFINIWRLLLNNNITDPAARSRHIEYVAGLYNYPISKKRKNKPDNVEQHNMFYVTHKQVPHMEHQDSFRSPLLHRVDDSWERTRSPLAKLMTYFHDNPLKWIINLFTFSFIALVIVYMIKTIYIPEIGVSASINRQNSIGIQDATKEKPQANISDATIVQPQQETTSQAKLSEAVTPTAISEIAIIGTIQYGSSKNDVYRILGEPTKNNDNSWRYGTMDQVQFDENGLIVGWSNRYRGLDAAMGKPTVGAHLVNRGSSMLDVLNVFGSPTLLNGIISWQYGVLDTIYFDMNSLIDRWSNQYHTFDLGLVK